MITVVFVCHGNICRSPAAEWVMKYLLNKYHIDDEFFVYSRATSTEEIGNDIYPPMKRELYSREIPFYEHRAKQFTKSDYEKADYIFYMDSYNKRNLEWLVSDVDRKYKSITCFTEGIDIIDDPWYTGDFENVLDQITQCVDDIIRNIRKK